MDKKSKKVFSPNPSWKSSCDKCEEKSCLKMVTSNLNAKIQEVGNYATGKRIQFRNPPIVHPCSKEELSILPLGVFESYGRELLDSLHSHGDSLNFFLHRLFSVHKEAFWGHYTFVVSPDFEGTDIKDSSDIDMILLSAEGVSQLICYLETWKKQFGPR